MGFLPDADQLELAATVRRFLADQVPLALSRSETGFDAAAWSTLARQLDLLGLTVPAASGGAGFSQREQALVFEEMGAALCGLPYFSTVALAVPTLLAGDQAVGGRRLPSVVAGECRAALALSEPGAVTDQWVGLPLATAADADHLTGDKTFVIDGLGADLLIVSAATADGPALFAVEATAPGLTRRPLATLDPTRRQAAVSFERTPATWLGPADILGPVRDIATLALAMEQVGAARRCLDRSVEYARTRTQFGRRIGSFQAIKHRCAEMFVAIEAARAAALHAAWAADEAPAEFPVAVAAAKVLASEAFLFCAKQNIQIHGGIGVTAEHEAHLYYRRAQSSALMFGGPAAHRDRLADVVCGTNMYVQINS